MYFVENQHFFFLLITNFCFLVFLAFFFFLVCLCPLTVEFVCFFFLVLALFKCENIG